MSWFKKAPLNTTGRIQSGNLVVTGQYSTNMPRPGGFSAHTTTASSLLSARVGGDGRMRVDEAKSYVERCQAQAQRQCGVPNAKVSGRKTSFLRAALSGVGSCFGIGLGSVRQAQPRWIRPDRAVPPVRANVDESKPVALAAMPSTHWRELAQSAQRVDAFGEHVADVRDILQRGLAEAQQRCREALDEVQSCRQSHRHAHNLRLSAEHRCLAIDQALVQTQSELQRTQQELSQHRTLLAGQQLQPVAVPTRARVANGETISLAARAQRVRDGYRQLCQRDASALAKAQSSLQALEADGGSMAARSAVQAVVVELQARLKQNQSLRDRAQAQLDNVNGASSPASSDTPSNASANVASRLEPLGRRAKVLTQRQHQHKASLVTASHALRDARDQESASERGLQQAIRMLEDAQVQVAGFDQELAALEPLQLDIDAKRQQALELAQAKREELRTIQAAETESLVLQPPGFDPTAAHPTLTLELRALSARLQTPRPSVADAAQWPLNDTLDIVSVVLADVSGGDAGLAQQTLHQLMQCKLTEFVPKPGYWLDGSPRTVGKPAPRQTPLEQLVEKLLDLPCGSELLNRLVAPQAEPVTQSQRDAVAVYYKAMSEVSNPKLYDGDTWMWLHSAALAACYEAHPGAKPTVLSVQQRAAFHGVRNGFVSVEKGSPYDQANQYLLRWADHTVRDIHGVNPLKTRRQAATAATQVGLPTPLRESNAEILQSCSELQRALTAYVIDVRKRAHTQGQAVDVQAMEPMLRASALLNYIEKNAGKHIRLDEMPIDRRTWRSVDRHTARWLETEGTLAATPKALKAAVMNLKLQAVSPPAAEPSAPSAQMLGLQADLLELQLEKKCTVLQALEVIQAHLGEIVQPAGTPATTTLRRERKVLQSIPENESLDMADDDRQGRITQLAHEMGCFRVQQSLERSRTLQPTVDAFMGTKEQWTSDELQNWLVPVVGENSSAVTMKHGRSMGISSLGLAVATSQVVEKIGFAARLDAEFMKVDQQVFRYAKQSRGMEAIIGQQQERRRRVGFALGAGWSLLALPSEDGFAASALGTWSRSRIKSDTQGVLLRAPVYGEKRLPQARETFDDMLNSIIKWRSLTDEASGKSYSCPIQAVLSRHPDASVGTIEQLNVVGSGTRSGVSATVSGGGPFFKRAMPAFFGALGIGGGVGTERRTEDTQYKTQGGSQGFVGTSVDTTAIVSANIAYAGHLGGVVRPGGPEGVALRARSSAATLQVDLHRQQAQSSATMVRQPDGTLIGEKAMEFNTYEPFEAAVRQRWDDWIEHGVRKGHWPDSVPAATRSLLVEQELESYMLAAKSSVRQGGTVTLSETLEVRPEVCAELSACLALEDLASARGDVDKAKAAAERRDLLLQADSSYFPYKLKAIVRSQIESSKGLHIAVLSQNKKSASANHEYDSFPKM